MPGGGAPPLGIVRFEDKGLKSKIPVQKQIEPTRVINNAITCTERRKKHLAHHLLLVSSVIVLTSPETNANDSSTCRVETRNKGQGR